MANTMDLAFLSMRNCYQTTTGASPTVTAGAQVIQIIPGQIGVDNVYFDGGTGNSASLTVMTRQSDWSGYPAKLSTVTIAGHPSAPDGTYQILDFMHREGTLALQLGNVDAQ
jgi:hypothetical protein